MAEGVAWGYTALSGITPRLSLLGINSGRVPTPPSFVFGTMVGWQARGMSHRTPDGSDVPGQVSCAIAGLESRGNLHFILDN
jgi:hypothetical protein